MKKQLLIAGIAMVMWGQIEAASRTQTKRNRKAAVQEIPSTELEKMQALGKRSFVSHAAEATAKSTLKGIGNSTVDVAKATGSALSAVIRPINTISHLGIPEAVNVIKPAVRTGLRPLNQLYRAGKSIWLSNSKRVAKHEINKLLEEKLMSNFGGESLANQKNEELRDIGIPFHYDTNSSSLKIGNKKPSLLDEYYHKQFSEQTYTSTLKKGSDLYNAKLQAAQDVAEGASLGVKLFKRKQLKKAMKEAIQNTTAESIAKSKNYATLDE